jgi:histidinol-phosphate/aromatic aminotransferase/cobyric acid decarboxylase-like protein
VAAALGIPPSEILDLSASLNPVAPDPRSIIARHLDALGRYPDAEKATAAMANALDAQPAQVLLTNGGAEAIALVASELGEGWVDDPDFSLYRRHLPTVEKNAPRWRSNPHNPSGRLAPPHERAAVWDEAFWPIATGTWTRGDADTGAIVIGSLTKVLACPGLRIGYVHSADDALIKRLAARQPRWSVNGLVCAALPEMLRTADLPTWTKEIGRLRADLQSILQSAGLSPHTSDANWLLVDAPGLRERLAPQGILVRDCTSFGLPGTVRIAVPDDDGLARLDDALQRMQKTT